EFEISSHALLQFQDTPTSDPMAGTPTESLWQRDKIAWQTKLRAENSGDLPPPSPPAEKATACEDQAGKASTSDGAGNSGRGQAHRTLYETFSLKAEKCSTKTASAWRQ